MNNIKKLIDQLEKCKYECIAGPLENNTSFIQLKEMSIKCNWCENGIAEDFGLFDYKSGNIVDLCKQCCDNDFEIT